MKKKVIKELLDNLGDSIIEMEKDVANNATSEYIQKKIDLLKVQIQEAKVEFDI